MDLRRLREETRTEHEATEAAMPLTDPGLTLETYTDVLRLLLPVLRSWEDWAAESAPAAVRPLLANRRRSSWIEADLRALGKLPLSPTRARAEPVRWASVLGARTPEPHLNGASAEFEAAFLGAFYVLEGSTLGGRFIARHVEGTLGLTPGSGNRDFRGHEEATGRLWRETTEIIAAVPEAYDEFVIGTAKRTFHAFGSVLGTLRLSGAGIAANG